MTQHSKTWMEWVLGALFFAWRGLSFLRLQSVLACLTEFPMGQDGLQSLMCVCVLWETIYVSLACEGMQRVVIEEVDRTTSAVIGRRIYDGNGGWATVEDIGSAVWKWSHCPVLSFYAQCMATGFLVTLNFSCCFWRTDWHITKLMSHNTLSWRRVQLYISYQDLIGLSGKGVPLLEM